VKDAANALAIALALSPLAVPLDLALSFAEAFFADNVDLFQPALVGKAPAYKAGDIGRVLAPAVPNCKNCGAPVNDHMKGCVNVTHA